MRIEYHRTLIADQIRNNALYAALKELIVPGQSIVADIGTGTGLLGLMAARLGASEVHMYESAPVAQVAAENIKRNKATQCHLMSCHSTEMLDPPLADIIICETLGNYAFEEDIVRSVNDARNRILKPGGHIIPNRIRQFASLVKSRNYFDELVVWDNVGHGIDLTPAKTKSLNNIYVRTFQAKDLVDGPNGTSFQSHAWDDVDFTQQNNSNREGQLQFTFSKPQNVYGLAIWWEAELTSNVSLSTSPDEPTTHWEQLYFPVSDPINVDASDKVIAAIRSITSEQEGTNIAWSIAHHDKDGDLRSRQSMDLETGYIA